MKTLDNAKTAVAYAQVAAAGLCAVYIGALAVIGTSEMIDERRYNKATRRASKNMPN